jgi:hypothetical protein
MSCKVDCEPHYCKIGTNIAYLSSTVLFAAGIGGMSGTMSGLSQHWAGRKCYNIIEDLILGGFNKSCIIIPRDRRCCVGQISRGTEPFISVISRVVERCGCQVVEIHRWFLCDGSVIIFLGFELYTQ